MDSEECELRYGAIDGYEDAVWANPTDIQRGPVLMPSDLAAAPAGTGPVTIRQMTPEERARYQPNRPTRDDLADDLAAGLSAPEIARKWAVSVERVHALIRHYRLPRKTAAEEMETKKQELAEIRKRIMAELAEKSKQCHTSGEAESGPKEVKTENPGAVESRKERGEVAKPKSPVREKLTPEVLRREIQEFTPSELGKRYGCGSTLIRKLLEEYGIENPRAAANARAQSETVEAQHPTALPTTILPVPASVAPTPAQDLPRATNTAKELSPRVRLAPALEEPISSGLNLTARGTYSADRLSRILAGIMAAVQEAGGEFAAYIDVRGRDAGGQTG